MISFLLVVKFSLFSKSVEVANKLCLSSTSKWRVNRQTHPFYPWQRFKAALSFSNFDNMVLTCREPSACLKKGCCSKQGKAHFGPGGTDDDRSGSHLSGASPGQPTADKPTNAPTHNAFTYDSNDSFCSHLNCKPLTLLKRNHKVPGDGLHIALCNNMVTRVASDWVDKMMDTSSKMPVFIKMKAHVETR